MSKRNDKEIVVSHPLARGLGGGIYWYTFHNVVGKYRMQYVRCIDVRIIVDSSGDIGIGYAVCSILDRYDGKRAGEIAQGRAKKDLNTPYAYLPWKRHVKKIRSSSITTELEQSAQYFCESVVRTIDKRIAKKNRKLTRSFSQSFEHCFTVK